jgi:hypothetical protein
MELSATVPALTLTALKYTMWIYVIPNEYVVEITYIVLYEAFFVGENCVAAEGRVCTTQSRENIPKFFNRTRIRQMYALYSSQIVLSMENWRLCGVSLCVSICALPRQLLEHFTIIHGSPQKGEGYWPS